MSRPWCNPFGRYGGVIVVAIALVWLSACGGSRPMSSRSETPTIAYAASLMAAPEVNRAGGGSVERLLPNRVLELGGHAITESDAVVRATVVDVTSGMGYVAADDPNATGDQEAPFADANCVSRSVHLTLRVEEVIGAARVELGSTIKVGMTLRGGPIDKARALDSFGALHEGIFFVKAQPFGFDGDHERFHLARGGASTMVVAPDGRLSFPLFSSALSDVRVAGPSWVAGQPVDAGMAIARLRALANQPEQTYGPR